ncbi:hypothetical protein [Pectinatus haikarae]|uniref:Glycine zipper 2TM domain-containing protein n=1 Tax=Pectinatus haikarae TaxID=349096 RepID=A0ABT9Y431_9FIRM|nr:hypothetical protein [Pectinatus haikarae]MDQ0202580.1 hypothetical protein [Pectinatus haikarae]
MNLKKIFPVAFSCLLAIGTLGIGGTTQASSAQPLPGIKALSSAAETTPAYSKATTGAVAGGIAGAIMGHNTKKGHTQHIITDAAIGAVVGGAIGHNT